NRVEDDLQATSLRCALKFAKPGDYIRFDPAVFPPDAPAVIYLQEALPSVHQAGLVIDGTDAGVILDGSQLPPDSDIAGLTLALGATRAQVKGLTIRNMPGPGVVVNAALAMIGDGSASVAAAPSNAIAGPPSSPVNVISGNKGGGVKVYGAGVVIQGNYIGVDPAGSKAQANGGPGVEIAGMAANALVGGDQPGQGNLISGNAGSGVRIVGAQTKNAAIKGNFIGVSLNGMRAIPNQYGIALTDVNQPHRIGGDQPGEGNLISGNQMDGVLILNGRYVSIAGNYIGAKLSGDAALPNNGRGVYIISGSYNVIGGKLAAPFECAAPCNLISGNKAEGILIKNANSASNVVQGNFIGATISGFHRLANGAHGVGLIKGATQNAIGGSQTGAGNLISGNLGVGVRLIDGANENTIIGNRIGVVASGEVALSNVQGGVRIENSSDNQIGGMLFQFKCVLACNLISGNQGDGVALVGPDSAGNVIELNHIGLKGDGQDAIPNAGNGVFVGEGAHDNTIQQNLIGGNAQAGVRIAGAQTAANKVFDNVIGLNIGLYVSVGNEIGVALEDGAAFNVIGSANVAGAANTIAGNRGHGVVVDGAHFNAIERNVIYGNGDARAKSGSGIFLTRGASNNLIGHPAEQGNMIFDNAEHGVEIKGAHQNTIIGNLIGLSNSGPAGNQGAGVYVYGDARANQIVGKLENDPPNPNVIAFNNSVGVMVSHSNSLGNTITRNSIFGNGGQGIKTVMGGNKELPPPQVSQAVVENGAWTIQGQTCANCAVHVYTDDGDEGQYFEGQTQASPAGEFAITINDPQAAYFALTATDAEGNTSEFGGLEDIEITGVEVTQVVQSQNPDNMTPLIAHKRTFVRVHVRSVYTDVANIAATLTLSREGAYQTLAPTGDPCSPTITVRVEPRRENLQDSFCFELPDEWTDSAGGAPLGLEAKVNFSHTVLESRYDNNVKKVYVTFQDMPPLDVKFALISYVGGLRRIRSFPFAPLPGSILPLPVFLPGDKIAAGDLDGDSQIEIVFADHMFKKLHVYDVDGQWLTTVNVEFHKGDALLIADITDDPFDKPVILLAHADGGVVDIMEWQNNGPALLFSFDGGFEPGSALAVGDVLPTALGPDYSGPEIVIATPSDHNIHVFGGGGVHLGDYDVDFTTNDALAIGDVVGGDDVDEVLIGGDVEQRIDVFRWTDAESGGDLQLHSDFISNFKTGGLLLAGDLDNRADDDLSPAEVITANSDCRCFSIYDWNSGQWRQVYLQDGFLLQGTSLAQVIWVQGSSGVLTDLDNDGGVEIVVGHPPNKLEIFSKASPGDWEPVTPTPKQFAGVVSLLARALPIADVQWESISLDFSLTAPKSPNTEAVYAQLAKLKALDGANAHDFYYGVLSSAGGVGGGVAWGYGLGAGAAGGKTVIHEFGHLLGRPHVASSLKVDTDNDDKPDTEVCNDEVSPVDPNYPYANGVIGGPPGNPLRFFGFDVGDPAIGAATKVYSATGAFDIMTYCWPQWLSDYTYIRMKQSLSSAQVQAQSVQSGPMLVLAAIVRDGGQRGAFKSVMVSPQAVASPLPDASPLQLRIEDANGAELAVYPLPVNPASLDGLSEESPALYASAAVPFPSQAAMLRLAHQGVELDSLAISPHPPTVTLLAPNGGEILDDSVILQWQGEDADGDPLTYALQYSADGGQTWTTVALDVRAESYRLDLSSLPGSPRARFRVVAHDGLWTAMDASDGDVWVANKPPVAFIEAPRPNSVFAADQNVLLRGRARDLESPSLPESAFVWESSISGELGTGRSLLLSSLPRGRHVVTLTVTDDQGEMARSWVVIYVGLDPTANYLPLMLGP
ncbi:MAG: hypothetical protein GXP42_09850, partial [Chloroflexi bacterium]|nr:hypothetical protein [Chloroflexota bacterium]